jgi:hypothetical protein
MPSGLNRPAHEIVLALKTCVRAQLKRTKIMKKFVSLLVASAAMIATAYAGEMAGVVKSYDDATKTVTMEDGTALVLPAGVTADGLAAGAKVKVTMDDATKAVTAIAVEK